MGNVIRKTININHIKTTIFTYGCYNVLKYLHEVEIREDFETAQLIKDAIEGLGLDLPTKLEEVKRSDMILTAKSLGKNINAVNVVNRLYSDNMFTMCRDELNAIIK